NYNKKLERVCIVFTNIPEDGSNFFPLLKEQLENKLKTRKIQNLVVLNYHQSGEMKSSINLPGITIPTGTPTNKLPSVDMSGIHGRAGFSPAYLLKIEIVGRGIASSGTGPKASATMRLSLSEFEEKLNVWKAELYLEWTGGGGLGVPGMVFTSNPPIKFDPIVCADQIFQKLEADGLLEKLNTARP
ncbi:MAG: hypothetical protein WAT51_07380, partial [Holophaga sp.]